MVGPKRYYVDEIHYDAENYENEFQEKNTSKVYIKNKIKIINF